MKLKALGINFDRFGRICAPIPGLLVSLGIDVELGQEVLLAVLSLMAMRLALKS